MSDIRELLAELATRPPFIPELHTDDCDDTSCVHCLPPSPIEVPLRGARLLNAKAAERAEATHWKRLGVAPPAKTQGGDR